MQRMTDIDQERVAYWRQDNVEGATLRGEDDDLADTLDRRDREHVAYYQAPDSSWQPTLVKRDDCVEIGGLPWWVVGPARDKQFFLAYNPTVVGMDMCLPMEVSTISNRAPADANETPMPIIPTTPEMTP